MATNTAQNKWRRKNRFVKSQLNVMARRLVHDSLDEIRDSYDLHGKAEAVSFSCYVTKALMQQADFNEEAARLLDVFRSNYEKDRDFFSGSRPS